MSGSIILLVCNANICRSVMAEFVLAEELSRHRGLAGITVASRGIGAMPAHRACTMVAASRQSNSWQRRLRRHGSQQIDTEVIEDARVILTATVSIRSAVVAMAPKARRKVFTVREALWLAEGYKPAFDVTGEEAISALVRYLDSQRGLRSAPRVRRSLLRGTENPFDIADGHLDGGRAHRKAVQQVEEATMELASILVLSETSGRLPARDQH